MRGGQRSERREGNDLIDGREEVSGGAGRGALRARRAHICGAEEADGRAHAGSGVAECRKLQSLSAHGKATHQPASGAARALCRGGRRRTTRRAGRKAKEGARRRRRRSRPMVRPNRLHLRRRRRAPRRRRARRVRRPNRGARGDAGWGCCTLSCDDCSCVLCRRQSGRYGKDAAGDQQARSGGGIG